MAIKSLTNNISFGAMGKIAYQTNKVVQDGLPFFKTTIKKGGIIQSEIYRCKELGHEVVSGYKTQGKKTLFFQSFFDLMSGKHAISIRYKNAAKDLPANEPVSVRYSIPWKVNDKKVPSFKDFFKMEKKMEKLKKFAKDVTNEVL